MSDYARLVDLLAHNALTAIAALWVFVLVCALGCIVAIGLVRAFDAVMAWRRRPDPAKYFAAQEARTRRFHEQQARKAGR